MKLVSSEDADSGIRITIDAKTGRYVLAESAQTVKGPDGTGTFGMLHASQLEDTFTRTLQDGNCDPPTLSESTRLHLLSFDSIAPVLGLSSSEEVPVT